MKGLNLASGPSLLQGHRLHWLRYPTHLLVIHLLPTRTYNLENDNRSKLATHLTGHPPWWVRRSMKPLVLRLIQKAASPGLTGILRPVLGKAVAPPACTDWR